MTSEGDTVFGGPENTDDYETVKPFGDDRDAEVLRIIEGADVEGEPDTPEEQRFTDIGFARLFAELHGDDIRYVPMWGKWIIWHRKRWHIDHNDVLVTKLAEDVAKTIYESLPGITDTDGAKKALAAERKAASSATTIRNFIKLARGADGVRIQPDDLDADPWLFGVENGYIDLHTGEFHEPDPSKLITKFAPVIYDAKAEALKFLAALEQWHPDPDVRRYLQLVAGHAIAGEAQGDHVLIIHHGVGRNGKGTFVRAMQNVFGPYFVVPDKSLLVQTGKEEHATVKASLFRTRLAVSSETAERHKLNEADIKNLTGGDRINAHWMRQDEFWFDPTHSLWLQTNYLPEIKGTDKGIASRIKLIPWTQLFEGANKNPALDEELREEVAGILNWIIEGCLRWQDEHLDDLPAMVDDATKEYLAAEDKLSRFALDEGYEFDKSGDGSVTAEELTNSLTRWTGESGEGEITAKDMNTWLKTNGCIDKRERRGDRRVKVWNGIRKLSWGERE